MRIRSEARRSLNGTLYFRIVSDTATDLPSTAVISAGRWYHVAGTYDGVEMRQYIDGNLDSSVPQTGPIPPSTVDLRVGRYDFSSVWKFHGVIDKVAIWDRALSETEVKLLYLNGGKP